MRELKDKHIEKLLEVLRERGPMTTKQLEQAMHLSDTAVWNRVSIARREGLIHVSGYSKAESNRNYAKRLWAVGNAPSVKSDARVYRENLAERKRRDEQIQRAAREITPFRDSMTAAFFGAAR